MKVLFAIFLISFGIISINASNAIFGSLKEIGALQAHIQFENKINEYNNVNYAKYGYKSTTSGAVNITTIIFVDDNTSSSGNMFLINGGPGYDYVNLGWVPYPNVLSSGTIYIYGNEKKVEE